MKVTKETWEAKMHNLQYRRASRPFTINDHNPNPIGDYKSHLSKINVGKYILDVGAGSGAMKKHLPVECNYTGIDAFPADLSIIKMESENLSFEDKFFETIFAFAMLDNVMDLEKTISEMKRVCSKNIYILTGIDIEPDQYHTIKITEQMLIDNMKPFSVGYREQLAEKVILIEFVL